MDLLCLLFAVLGSLLNQSVERIQGLQNVEQCFPMQKNITIRLTNEQVYYMLSSHCIFHLNCRFLFNKSIAALSFVTALYFSHILHGFSNISYYIHICICIHVV